MISVFVKFRYPGNFDEQSLRNIAAAARGKFEGMPGLRSKAFTLDCERREATNFYVWESAEAAAAFFTDALTERLTSLYGVRPAIEFAQVAAFVDNARA